VERGSRASSEMVGGSGWRRAGLGLEEEGGWERELVDEEASMELAMARSGRGLLGERASVD